MIHNFTSDFEIAARIDADYELRIEKWEAERRFDERLETVQKDKDQQSENTQALLLTRIITGVSPREMARIEERVGSHQEALIEALQENREHLDASNERLEHLLGRAHVLEDGRRVFKTEDGRTVFDEHGQQVSSHTVDANEIEDWRPRAETYLAERDQNVELRRVQQELHDYQGKLDNAQSRLDDGNLSRSDFDDLNDLLMDAPSAVRAKLPTNDPAYQAAGGLSSSPNIDLSMGLDDPISGQPTFGGARN